MDLIIISLSVILFIISIGVYLENTEEKSFLLFSLLCVLLFGWCVTAHIVKEPVVSRHVVQNLIAEDGSNYQVVSYENGVVNLNSKTGKSFSAGQIVEVKRYGEVWSLGVFCVIGSTTYTLVSEKVEE